MRQSVKFFSGTQVRSGLFKFIPHNFQNRGRIQSIANNRPLVINFRGTERARSVDNVIQRENNVTMEDRDTGNRPVQKVETPLGYRGNERRFDDGLDGLDRIHNDVPGDGSVDSERMAHRLRIRYRSSRGRYLTDVIVPPRSADIEKTANELETYANVPRTAENYGFRVIAVHEDHVHVAHGCSYSNRSCRCS